MHIAQSTYHNHHGGERLREREEEVKRIRKKSIGNVLYSTRRAERVSTKNVSYIDF
jgi:hypothetical protein